MRSTVVAVAWLDHSPDWDALVARLDDATRRVPIFRRRIVELPGRISTPMWTADTEFDLGWHLRRIESPWPHTPATVLAFARNAAMAAFDPARPLWEFTLIDQVDGGAALVMKLHHSLTDGVGGMEMALLLFDLERDAPAATDAAPALVDRSPVGGPITAALAHDASRLAGVMARGTISTARAARRPFAATAGAAGMARSVWRTVAPASKTLSPIMQGRGTRRELHIVEVDLADLKLASAAGGGSINDGFLAAATGGMRRYHEIHGTSVPELRVTMPISIRTAADPLGGNRITLMRFKVPVAERDPGRRIGEIGRVCGAARGEPSIAVTDWIAAGLNVLPSGMLSPILKHVDFVASDVPAFAFPVYLAGARVVGYVAFGPTIGAAANLTLLSYEGVCTVGINVDAAAVADGSAFADCIREGFDEVLAMSGAVRPARVAA